MTITIKTSLNSAIYKSEGGGETCTHYEWTTGPRNLLKAIETLAKHSASMERGYGNVGHMGSWIEIDGTRIGAFDIQYVARDEREMYTKEDLRFSPGLAVSRTQKARELIDLVASGKYEA
jgi:hypothetical protein